MKLNNSLGSVLGKGSAKHGVEHWWAQRVTAIALAPLGVWFLVSLLFVSPFDYPNLSKWMTHSWNAVLLVAVVLVVAQHSYLGIRVVVEDYVHSAGARTATLLVLRFAHGLLAAAGVFAVLKIALGSAALGGGA